MMFSLTFAGEPLTYSYLQQEDQQLCGKFLGYELFSRSVVSFIMSSLPDDAAKVLSCDDALVSLGMDEIWSRSDTSTEDTEKGRDPLGTRVFSLMFFLSAYVMQVVVQIHGHQRQYLYHRRPSSST